MGAGCLPTDAGSGGSSPRASCSPARHEPLNHQDGHSGPSPSTRMVTQAPGPQPGRSPRVGGASSPSAAPPSSLLPCTRMHTHMHVCTSIPNPSGLAPPCLQLHREPGSLSRGTGDHHPHGPRPLPRTCRSRTIYPELHALGPAGPPGTSAKQGTASEHAVVLTSCSLCGRQLSSGVCADCNIRLFPRGENEERPCSPAPSPGARHCTWELRSRRQPPPTLRPP